MPRTVRFATFTLIAAFGFGLTAVTSAITTRPANVAVPMVVLCSTCWTGS